MAFLVDIADPERRVELGAVTTIGRAEGSHVLLDDPGVSQRHAEVRRQPDGSYRLIDLGSRRGVVHRDRRVSEARLEHGDELLVGVSRLRFEDEAGPGPVEPAQATGDFVDGVELRRAYEKLRTAVGASQTLGDAHDMVSLLEAVLVMALRVVPAERGAIVLLHPTTGNRLLQLGRSADGKTQEIVLSTSLMSECLQKRAVVITADAMIDERFNRAQSLVAHKIRSALCVPLVHRDELLGLLHLDSHLAAGAFGPKDADLVNSIATQAATAIKSALLSQQVKAVAAEERERLQRLVENLPDGVLLLDASRRILVANDRARELLPLLTSARPGEVLDRLGPLPLSDLLAGRSRAPVDVVLPGPPRRVLVATASDSGGRGGEVVLVLRDDTEKREHEARSAQEQRLALIGQLAGGIAHDFNNLLSVISNFATFVADEIEQPHLKDDVAQILEASARAADLTGQLLAFGRRDLVRPRVIEVDRLVKTMEKLLSRTMGENIQVGTRSSGSSLRVKADSSRLEQVLLNLAVNARDAMASGGTLTIETEGLELDEGAARLEGVRPGPCVAISVTDTGSGMSPEVLGRVFEPFFTTKEVGKGTGLGLATAYGIIQQAGGAITARSQPGRGSTFRVLLPATDEQPEAHHAPRAHPNGGRETILLAEDQPAVRELARRILRDAGYRVMDAGTGNEALDLATGFAGQIDLLLTDLVMPGMSGKELATALLKARPSVRVLYMSGYYEGTAGSTAGAPDAASFLPKPFKRDDLLSRVRMMLG